MKTLLFLMCLFTLTVNAQSYECKNFDKTFNVVIKDNCYNLIIDEFIITTELDTIIEDSICTKYVPLNRFRDTLTIFKDNYLSLTGSGLKTTFIIVRELEYWEEEVLFNKSYYLLKID